MKIDVNNWPAVLEECVRLFADKTIKQVPKAEQKNYRTNRFMPKYTFGIKDNVVVCAWVGNFRKDRLGRPKKDGTCTVFSVADPIADFRYDTTQLTEGFTSKEWDFIGKELVSLYERLSEA